MQAAPNGKPVSLVVINDENSKSGGAILWRQWNAHRVTSRELNKRPVLIQRHHYLAKVCESDRLHEVSCDVQIVGICPSSEYLRQKAAGFSGGRGSSDG